MKKQITFLLVLTILVFQQSYLQAQTFVDASATGDNDGTSWADAYTTLHEALENYATGDEIWVAAGTYYPQQPRAWPGDDKNTFFIYQDVGLYGGFNGTETERSQRDSTNVTILSGDLNDNDVLDDFETNREDNVINIMYVDSLISQSTVIDGFTFRGGHADIDDEVFPNKRGAGIFSYGSPLVRNCRFTQNYTIWHAAGIYYYQAEADGGKVENCLFENNRVIQFGAGIAVGTVSGNGVSIDNCRFINNHAGSGGGIAFINTEGTIENCAFNNNTAISTFGGGGAIIVSDNTGSDRSVLVKKCTFFENSAADGAGLIYLSNSGRNRKLLISNCEFIGNESAATGADTSPFGGGLAIGYFGGNPENDSLLVSNCSFTGNHTQDTAGGLGFDRRFGTNNYLLIERCLFQQNVAEEIGGALVVLSGRQASRNHFEMRDCEVFENQAVAQGEGGIAIYQSGLENKVLIFNTHFRDNTAPVYEAVATLGIAPGNSGSSELINCLFTGHNSGESYAIAGASTEGSELILTSCTFAENSSASIGVEFTTPGGEVVLNNTILATTGNKNFQDGNPDSSLGSIVSLGGNLISDFTLNSVLNVTDQEGAAPLFEPGTYQLSSDSPAIDAGVVIENAVAFDFAGDIRVQGGCIDIGAFESSFDANMECLILTSIIDRTRSNTYVTIAPNPAGNQVDISFENGWRDHVEYEIFDPLGQMLQCGTFAKFQDTIRATIDLSGLPSGQYYLQLSNGFASAAQKFIKL